MTPAKKLEKLKEIYETVSLDRDGINVSTHAGYNLSGAIIDIQNGNGKCDKITLQTLRRVRNQLAQMAKVLGI